MRSSTTLPSLLHGGHRVKHQLPAAIPLDERARRAASLARRKGLEGDHHGSIPVHLDIHLPIGGRAGRTRTDDGLQPILLGVDGAVEIDPAKVIGEVAFVRFGVLNKRRYALVIHRLPDFTRRILCAENRRTDHEPPTTSVSTRIMGGPSIG